MTIFFEITKDLITSINNPINLTITLIMINVFIELTQKMIRSMQKG